ncbi:MAG TPA: hypothetical protein VNT50_11200 [Microbacterium sp.]|uniref:hypothetical protein n=1 Tax=Microbacterium sp. TaxID=51671 RepID=UPI002CD135D6|nr:hypothetical protein [Microbacterium sp.]HWI32050.1 hypothetical protein [Microbacterium sp.]
MSARSIGRRAIGAIALIAALAGGVAAITALSPTRAAWTDQTVASATVSSGTWVAVPVGNTCTALDWRGVAVGTCAVRSITYDEWGWAGNHTRNMYLTFTVSSVATQSIRFDVDLATATGTPSGNGTWNWSTAATLAWGQMTPTSACTALPRLQGTTVSGWTWLLSPPVYFSATDNRAGAAPGSISCT